VCKERNYVYTKTIWHIDPELWHVTYVDKYDKSGRLWKVIEYYLDVCPSYQGLQDADFVGMCCVDVQRAHATLSTLLELKLGQEFDLALFTLSNLEQLGH